MPELEYVQENCPKCGFTFMVPEAFPEQRRKDHKTFYCPSCGSGIWYPADNEEERLRKQVEALRKTAQRERDRNSIMFSNLEHEVRVRTGHQGQVAKLKKRIAELEAQ